jgi:hypothetical protein
MEPLEVTTLLHTQEARGSSPCAPTMFFSPRNPKRSIKFLDRRDDLSNSAVKSPFFYRYHIYFWPSFISIHRNFLIFCGSKAHDAGKPNRIDFGFQVKKESQRCRDLQVSIVPIIREIT